MTTSRHSACRNHPGWAHSGGESRCHTCGVRRFTTYGALRPPGLPAAMAPRHRDRREADRAAAFHVMRGPAAAPWGHDREPHQPLPRATRRLRRRG
ncbi:DUF6255 family natural product biosynthesis protein [Streptomyces sp. NPDC037389]|uniref:DUF6255 family natural product biosynthesis protein n=1 Tax=Streptomyces sp. NPDC037389 TaxID=3155369 RepID=UPI0033E136A2